ncbi:diacylglycerol kinase [Strigomonas culicis]|uniref:Diacylglycerol kinase n=1 Tax=Strigomonas culicis TaxID=28005 RepID=S9UCT1_9TRYP|nr:diacylglycerol kinase [Strigomonas culicis]|eukprot:EPY28592.1 diacylglycerol kinase [Strigomonas culicis]
MQQVDACRQELAEEFFYHFFRKYPSKSSASASATLTAARRKVRIQRVHGTCTPFYILPAIAPLPLGTGNDYSNSVGFGKGLLPFHYTQSSPAFAAHHQPLATDADGAGRYNLATLFCAWWGEVEIGHILSQCVEAPAVPFDRWSAEFATLACAQNHFLLNTPSRPHRRRSKLHHAAALPPRAEVEPASYARYIDWHALRQQSARPRANYAKTKKKEAEAAVRHPAVDGYKQYDVINYLGIGFDAFVARQFDTTRKRHPELCATRAQNYVVYGLMGFHGAVQCRSIRKLIPYLSVPSAAGDDAQRRRRRKAMEGIALPSGTKALVLTNVSCYSAGTKPWDAESGESFYNPISVRGFDAAAPSSSSSSSAAWWGGWSRRLRAWFTPQANTAAEAARLDDRRAQPQEVSINDRKFELQAMGGLLHYGALSLGLAASTKLAQISELFIFVLCRPEDLCTDVLAERLRLDREPSTHDDAFLESDAESIQRMQREILQQRWLDASDDPEEEAENGGGAPHAARPRAGSAVTKEMEASLSVQIDGEALEPIQEPTIIHVRLGSTRAIDRLYVRCYNPQVVRVNQNERSSTSSSTSSGTSSSSSSECMSGDEGGEKGGKTSKKKKKSRPA